MNAVTAPSLHTKFHPDQPWPDARGVQTRAEEAAPWLGRGDKEMRLRDITMKKLIHLLLILTFGAALHAGLRLILAAAV